MSNVDGGGDMGARLMGLCRGNAKLFLRIAVDGLPDMSSLELDVRTDEGEQVPAMVFADDSAPVHADGAKSFILVLPQLDVTQHIELSAVSSQINRKHVGNLHVSPKMAKWLSRLNYRMAAEEMSKIRDYDVFHTLNRVVIFLRTCAEDRSVLSPAEPDWHWAIKGVISVPCDCASGGITVKCFDSMLQELDVPVTVMPPKRIECSRYRSAPLDEYEFALRLPMGVPAFFIAAYDSEGSLLSGFEATSDHLLNQLRDNTYFSQPSAADDPDYGRWVEWRRPTPSELAIQRSSHFADAPKFSIVVPLFKTPVDLLRDLIASVIAQSYDQWELILVNASPDCVDLSEEIALAASRDERIVVVTLEGNLGIGLNTNEGIKRATGDFIVFVDHDDFIEPHALYEYACAIEAHPDVEMLYCDEDRYSAEKGFRLPFFKPDFSIDMVRAGNFVCHMLVVRASMVRAVGLLDGSYDGAQDHDLVLKVAERTDRIEHICQVLYHWREIPGSTSLGMAEKPYAKQAGIRAVQSHLDRCGLEGYVTDGVTSGYRVCYALKDNPLVSIVIPSKDAIDLLDNCLVSIKEKTSYSNYEVVVVENNSTNEATFAYYETVSAQRDNVRVVYWDGRGFNYSAIVNYGVRQARGEYIVLLNNDIEVISPNWLDEMLAYCRREDVGAVGACLLYPDGSVQHAGISLSRKWDICPLFRHIPYASEGYYQMHRRTRAVCAVTAACLMTSKEIFDFVGGFTEDLAVAYNDVDFCLKVWEVGRQVIYAPYAMLYHHESVTRGRDVELEKRARLIAENGYMQRRWATEMAKGDSYLNPNFGHDLESSSYFRLGWEFLDNREA